MAARLNLTLNETTVRRIKTYAERHKMPVSKITEDYFEKLTRPKAYTRKGRFSERAAGIINDIIIEDIFSAKEEYFKEKYGISKRKNL